MADTPKGAEGTEGVGFDIDAALNTKGFAEFLAEHPDADTSIDNAKHIESRLETFILKGEIVRSLRELYTKTIQPEAGIKLEPADMDSVDAHLAKEAVSNPERLREIRSQMNLFKTLPDEIAGLEEQLTKLGAAPKEKKDLKGLVIEQKELGDKWNGLKRFAVDMFTSEGIVLDTQIETLTKKADLLKAKEGLFADTELMGKLATITRKKVEDNLLGLMAKGSIKDLEKAQEEVGRFVDIKDVNGDGSGFDYLGDGDVEKFNNDVDTELEKIVRKQIKEVVTNSKLGNNPLNDLEKKLKDLTEKETLGSKDAQETKDFLRMTIEEVLGSLPTSTSEEKAKKLLLGRILIKLSK